MGSGGQYWYDVLVDDVLGYFISGGVGCFVVVVEQFYQSGKRYFVGGNDSGVGVVLLGVVNYFVNSGGFYYVFGGFFDLLGNGDSVFFVVELF